MSTPPAARLIEDPEIAANIRRLSEQTGVPIARFAAWLEQPAPEGMDPDLWRSALAHRARTGNPWPEHKLRELGYYAVDTEPEPGQRQNPAA